MTYGNMTSGIYFDMYSVLGIHLIYLNLTSHHVLNVTYVYHLALFLLLLSCDARAINSQNHHHA